MSLVIIINKSYPQTKPNQNGRVQVPGRLIRPQDADNDVVCVNSESQEKD